MTDGKPPVTGYSSNNADFSADSDYDLLEMMSWKETDERTAREAWAEFHRRHSEYLYGVCRAFAHGLGGDAAAEDITAETFVRVYAFGAASFKPTSSTDSTAIRLHVRAWLGRIAENVAKNAYRGKRGHQEVHLEPEHWGDIAEQQKRAPSPEAQQLRHLMDEILDDRERDILRVTFQWYDPTKDNQRLPNDVAADLASRWGTTSENIRQIRSRALMKLKEALIVGAGCSSSKEQEARRSMR